MPVWEKKYHLHLHKKALRCRHTYTYEHMYTHKQARVGRLTRLDTSLHTQAWLTRKRAKSQIGLCIQACMETYNGIQISTHTHTHNRYVNMSLWVNMYCKLAHLSACTPNASHVACFPPSAVQVRPPIYPRICLLKNECTHILTHRLSSIVAESPPQQPCVRVALVYHMIDSSKRTAATQMHGHTHPPTHARAHSCYTPLLIM